MTRGTIQALKSAMSWASCQTPNNCHGKNEEKGEARKADKKISIVEDILKRIANELFIIV